VFTYPAAPAVVQCGAFRTSIEILDDLPKGAVAVEEVPWGDGKRTVTKAYMLGQIDAIGVDEIQYSKGAQILVYQIDLGVTAFFG
jgi:hypothetical protein